MITYIALHIMLRQNSFYIHLYLPLIRSVSDVQVRFDLCVCTYSYANHLIILFKHALNLHMWIAHCRNIACDKLPKSATCEDI